MTLAEQLYRMMQDNQSAMQPADLVTGTVTSAKPLEITIDTAMQPLKKEVLYLTEAVVEKKIPVLDHKHTISTLAHSHSNSAGGTTTGLSGSYLGDASLVSEGADATLQGEDIICYEHGEPLPVEEGYIILNRALAEGDKVLLLRVQHGQKFIVLSRIFEHKE